MATAPPLSTPRLGDPLNPEFSYVKRKSAEHQADMWNYVLAEDPVLGPTCGLKAGVGFRDAEGRWMVVWVLAR